MRLFYLNAQVCKLVRLPGVDVNIEVLFTISHPTITLSYFQVEIPVYMFIRINYKNFLIFGSFKFLKVYFLKTFLLKPKFTLFYLIVDLFIQSCYYVHFWTNTLEKCMDPRLIPPTPS